MSQCAEQGFSGITNEHLGIILVKAEEFGIPGLAGKGTSGEASHMGVTIKWSYDENAHTLMVQCTESPFLLPCSVINSKINDLVTAVLGRTGMGGEASAPTPAQTEDQA